MKNRIPLRFHPVTFPDSILRPIREGHPWGFSKKFQPFLKGLKGGALVQIQNSQNKPIGYGIYTPGELSILKVFWHGEVFEPEAFFQRLESRLRLRDSLWESTNTLRLIHGENDFIPGINIDFHDNTLITRAYSPFLIPIARLLQRYVIKFLQKTRKYSIIHSFFQVPHRISGEWKASQKARAWKGKIPARLNIFQGNINFFINPLLQKGGIYNDIRNLRNYLLENEKRMTGVTALNLFSNNGFLSKVLEKIGYSDIDSLEDSQELIQIARENLDPEIHHLIKMNIFKNLSNFLESNHKLYDLIIIDPPSLTGGEKDKPTARLVYEKLFSSCLPFLKENGHLILCSCSNRIHLQDFERIALETFKKKSVYMKLLDKLKPEPDHPTLPEFPEGNYFKVLIYKKGVKY